MSGPGGEGKLTQCQITRNRGKRRIPYFSVFEFANSWNFITDSILIDPVQSVPEGCTKEQDDLFAVVDTNAGFLYVAGMGLRDFLE